jgi:hypothetical protein
MIPPWTPCSFEAANLYREKEHLNSTKETDMRRQISPREALTIQFKRLERLVGSLPPTDLRVMIVEELESLRELAISFTADQPPLAPAGFGAWLANAHPVSVKFSMERHLLRQIPLEGFEGVSPADLTAKALEALDGIDSEMGLDSEIARAASETIAAFPMIKAQGYHGDRLEALLRESLGLEGTPPQPDGTDVSAIARNAERALAAFKAAVRAEREAPEVATQAGPIDVQYLDDVDVDALRDLIERESPCP